MPYLWFTQFLTVCNSTNRLVHTSYHATSNNTNRIVQSIPVANVCIVSKRETNRWNTSSTMGMRSTQEETNGFREIWHAREAICGSSLDGTLDTSCIPAAGTLRPIQTMGNHRTDCECSTYICELNIIYIP
jgi:hypothetical protein